MPLPRPVPFSRKIRPGERETQNCPRFPPAVKDMPMIMPMASILTTLKTFWNTPLTNTPKRFIAGENPDDGKGHHDLRDMGEGRVEKDFPYLV